jgi:hypothetical protein
LKIARPAAIFPAVFLLALEFLPAVGALYLFRHRLRVRFMILSPPVHPARIAAKSPIPAVHPFLLKILPAVGTNPLRFLPRCLPPYFAPLFHVVRPAAAITAKSSLLPFLLPLFHGFAAIRARVYGYVIISFRIMILYPACVTAEFLSVDVTCWLELLPTVLAVFLFFRLHLIPSLLPLF